MSYQWLTLWRYADTFLEAAWLTLQVTLLAFALAVALGLLAALAKSSPLAPLRWISHCYVEFIRNTPVLLQILSSFWPAVARYHHERLYRRGAGTGD